MKDNTTGSTAQDTLQLDIEVEPDVCDFGQVGSAYKLTLIEMSDEFKPGDTVSIEVEVENQGQNDIRVQVEAFLFMITKILQIPPQQLAH